MRAWRWDAEAQEWRSFQPNAAVKSLTELNHGDALLAELTEGARWWQSGSAPAPVVFLGEFTDERRSEIRGWVDDTRALVAERWGVEAPFTTYVGDRDAVAGTYRAIRGSTGVTRCGDYNNSIIFLVDGCVNGGAHAHEYFHALQYHLIGKPAKRVPGWMIEGSAQYALIVYRGAASPSQSPEARIEESIGASEAVLGYYELPALPDLEDYSATINQPGGLGFTLGFLGVAWLAQRAGEQSIVDFFVRLASEPSWREAFEGAFGITADDFYGAFAAYRSEAAPLLPHLSDDSDAPLLLLVGDAAAESAEALQEEFDDIQAFFVDRLGAEKVEYTVFVAADDASVAAAHLRAFGERPPASFCDTTNAGFVTVIDLRCRSAPPFGLVRPQFEALRDAVAPRAHLPEVPRTHDERGPVWLVTASETYTDAWYRTEAGLIEFADIRNREVSIAAGVSAPLSGFETRRGFHENPRDAAALAFLALEWLAERAGESAIMEYYRLLPESSSWEEAFKSAFGVAIDEFYRAFEAYRAEVAQPFPHLLDDRDEPVLVFVGDVPAETQGAVRAEFDGVRAFFSERFATGPVDYTVYVGADRESLAAPHVRVYGTEPADYLCDRPTYRFVGIVNLECAPPRGFDRSHVVALREQLAPWASLPSLSAGSRIWGPVWLTDAALTYASHVYRADAGESDLEEIRAAELSRATRIARPLRSMATNDGFYGNDYWEAMAVGFLAVEWLLERAGAPALFDYYRQLPGSATWQEAFEAAFGIAIDDFYEAFEAYRAEIAPPVEAGDAP